MNRYLRQATSEDVDILFRWANDTLVRANSFSTSQITYEEHVIWYQQLLENPNVQQYIYMADNMPIGQARVSVTEEVAEIGYSISYEQRGQGYGRELLYMISEQVWKDFPDVKSIIGKVKPANIASQKAFTGAGYEQKCYVYEMVRE